MAKPRKEPPTNAAKKLLAEKLAWVFVLLIAAGSFQALKSIPSGGEFQPTLHVASRYLQQGAEETGTHSLSLAIWTDYRSFDLLVLAFLLLTAALGATAVFLGEKTPTLNARSSILTLPLMGTLGLLGLGLFCLKNGSNFLDYEPFASLFGVASARHDPALLAGVCLAVVLVGTLILFLKTFLDWKGGRHDG
jgi:hypothetical protein